MLSTTFPMPEDCPVGAESTCFDGTDLKDIYDAIVATGYSRF
jgi:hypothetical protein